MFSPIRKPWILTATIAVVVILTTVSTFKTRTAIEEAEDASKCFNTIEENVADANQALKYAALAPTKALMQEQFDKMLVTRASADHHYAMLKANKTLSPEDQAVVDTMQLERAIYRVYQNATRDAILGGNRTAIWQAFQPYEMLKIRYVQRARDMHERMEVLENEAKMSFYIDIVVIAFGVIFALICSYLWDRWLIIKNSVKEELL